MTPSAAAFPLSRVLWTLAIALLCVGLAWQMLVQFQDVRAYVRPPAATISWFPGSVAADIQQAQADLKAGDQAAALERARAAFATSPLSVEAIALIARMAQQAGETTQSEALDNAIMVLTRRNPETLAALLQNSNTRSNRTEFLRLLDILMRVGQQDQQQTLFPIVASLITDPQQMQELVGLLADDPKWRIPFLDYLAKEGDLELFPTVMEGLSAGATPPLRTRWQPYLNRLIEMGEPEQAYAIWAGIPDSGGGERLDYLFDGQFSLPPGQLPFEWTFEKSRRFMLSRSSLDGRPALMVEFVGAKTRFYNIYQELLLPPGNYSLTGKVMTDNLQNERGLYWRVYCRNETSLKAIAETERFHGRVNTRNFEVSFTVPETDCASQRLRLELAAPFAMTISGRIWFDALAIRRLPQPEAN